MKNNCAAVNPDCRRKDARKKPMSKKVIFLALCTVLLAPYSKTESGVSGAHVLLNLAIGGANVPAELVALRLS
jgi:hypothetical protein